MCLSLALAVIIGLQPAILTREQWGAKAPILTMKQHSIRFITVHHAGVPTKKDVPNETKLRNLQAWCQREDRTSFSHVKPAWPDIPYHFYIFWDGQIAECRNSNYVGDTNTTYDPTGHLLICLEGQLSTEQPTGAQLAALKQMLEWSAKQYSVPRVRIGCHRDYADTDCPGKNVRPLLPSLRISF
jgi:hypothetical protein